MKRLLTLIFLIFALTVALASCDFLNPTPDENGSGNTEGGGTTEHTHSFGEWVTTTEPTCTENGESAPAIVARRKVKL